MRCCVSDVYTNNLGKKKLSVLILRPAGIKLFSISLALQKEENGGESTGLWGAAGRSA